jgi:exopolysaccharide biosynthesis polyprenyl glycosylphosphotransferase
MPSAAARREGSVTDLDVRSADHAAGLARPDRRIATDPLTPAPNLATGDLAHSLSTRAHSLVAALVAIDAAAIAIAVGIAYVARFGTTSTPGVAGPTGWPVFVVVGVLWLGAVAAQRSYESRFLGVGTEEYRRVSRATCVLFGALAIASYLLKFDLARGFVALAFPIGLVLLMAGRFSVRQWLRTQRASGRLCHRVLIVGDRATIVDFVAQLRLEPAAGFVVIGACMPASDERLRESDEIPVLGDYGQVAAVARTVGADVVAVTAADSITGEGLRRLAWSLEGQEVDLVVAPAVTEVAGPRVTVRPVAGLPLMYVDEPRFTGIQRVLKGTMDRVMAAIGLVFLSPLLLAVAVAIRLTSRGPALFRQVRIGQGGRPFVVVKFRTMSADAESQRHQLGELNDGDGLLFKIANDPRITKLGRWLRTLSIDELPQLINVLRGEMSLVGPRPLAVDDAAFVDHERRRHLVKPGMTGLWQVSGRDKQAWDDAVRLDLYYVENWSLSMDLVILLRTAVAVFRGS